MKKIIALALALVLVLGLAAVAAGEGKTITVNPMTMTVNGQEVTPLKSDGTAAEVFAYDGATYVPLRYLAELLGIEVGWDAANPNEAILTGNVVGMASRDLSADYVIVGAGMGGLSAAIEAARSGRSVILLEKQSRAGGSSALCEGYFWSTESKLNQETGQGLGTEDMKAALKAAADGHAVDGLIDNICDISSEIMDRFIDGGAKFYNDKFTVGGGAIPNIQVFVHENKGDGLMQAVLAIAEKESNIQIVYRTKGTDLIYEDGEVKGVTVEDKDGTYNVYGGTTILATGGYLRNQELMDEYEPGWYIDDPYCAPGSTGDGHIMAMELGAHMIGGNFGCVWRFGNVNGYTAPNYSGMAPMMSFFRVNQEGKRVLNEYGAANVNANNDTIIHQTNRRVYCFMDSTSAYTGMAELSVAAGFAYKADTLEELCEKYGIDTETFMATVNAYNEVKASGEDDPDFHVPNAYMVSMTEGPFYATIYEPWATNCLGGLEVDEYCRILDADNQPIPNLYGVGELIEGSFVGDGNYPCCGSCLAAGAYGGPLAVRHAEGKYTT